VNITINVHDAAFGARSFGETADRPSFVTLDANGPEYGVSLFLRDAAACDGLIQAAVLAKSLLLGETSAPVTVPAAPLPDRGRYDAKSVAEVDEGVQPAGDLYRTAAPAEHAGDVEPQCPMFWGTGTGETPMRCQLAPYHAGMHENGGIQWGEPISSDEAQA
jgi:hypothetical protein